MGKAKISDPLFGALHPEVSITEVAGLNGGDFTFQVDGKFHCHLTCEPVNSVNLIDEAGEWVLWSRAFPEGPGQEVHRGSRQECVDESVNLHRFLLSRWQSHLATAARSRGMPRIGSGRAGLAVALLALVIASGAWLDIDLDRPAAKPVAETGIADLLTQLSLINAELPEPAQAPEPRSVEVKPLASPEGPPKFLEEVSRYQATPEIVEEVPEVEPPVITDLPDSEPAATEPAEDIPDIPTAEAPLSGGVDLLAAFGVPEPQPGSAVDVEARLREEWRSTRKAGISYMPEPGSLITRREIPTPQLGGGTLESIEEIKDFGFNP